MSTCMIFIIIMKLNTLLASYHVGHDGYPNAHVANLTVDVDEKIDEDKCY